MPFGEFLIRLKLAVDCGNNRRNVLLELVHGLGLAVQRFLHARDLPEKLDPDNKHGKPDKQDCVDDVEIFLHRRYFRLTSCSISGFKLQRL